MTRPFSYHRLLAFGFMELPPDINGVPGSPYYQPFYEISEMRAVGSVRVEHSGAWSGRRHHFASVNEYRIFLILEGNPFILDIREQYPLVSKEVLEALLRGERPNRNEVMTIDLVLTLPPFSPGGPLRYKALSVKPEGTRSSKANMLRAQREKSRLLSLGWDWGYVDVPSKVAVANHGKLHGWCTSHGLDSGWEKARDLAALFYRTTSNKTLRRQLAMLAKRLGIREEDQWYTFAAAYYLGFLALDHRYTLDEDVEPVLAPPRNG